jgi:hypothetical protein
LSGTTRFALEAKLTLGTRSIDVDKSSYHHVSQNEIAGDKPCSRHLSGNSAVFDYGVNQDLACDCVALKRILVVASL